jgi:hypothetical protein
MIDLDPRARAAAEKIPGSSFQLVGFENLHHSGSFAAIMMSQVLEHALDPMRWLIKAKSLLSKDAVLAVAVPNFGGVYRLLGARDPYITPPEHLNYFTARSLRLAFEQSGLRLRKTNFVSQINVTHPTARLSLKRRLGGRIWNSAIAPFVDLCGQGIILCAFASRAD